MNISGLADADLAEIFKRLPPSERLLVSEVCRRWLEISRKTWLDVKHLDFTPPFLRRLTPAILAQCPNLQSVFARNQSFGFKQLYHLHDAKQLLKVAFYDCKFQISIDPAPTAVVIDDSFVEQVFSRNAERASWNELILHNALFDDQAAVNEGRVSEVLYIGCDYIPPSLRRLQLSGMRSVPDPIFDNWKHLAMMGFSALSNLECLILHPAPGAPLLSNVNFGTSQCSSSLRELCIRTLPWCDHDRSLVSHLPMLEVLFLNDFNDDPDKLIQLIASPSVLRILVLSGEFQSDAVVQVPARPWLQDGHSAAPLPRLHIFVGREASERLHFAPAAVDNSIIVYPIDRPMPEFLEREDIAPIFKDVWVAEQIKAMANFGGKLWDYDTHDTAVSVQRY